MYKIYLISPPGHSFDMLLKKNATFFKEGIADSAFYCIREALNKLGYDFAPVDEAGEDAKYFFHFEALRTDIIEKWPKAVHIYFACEPRVVDGMHTAANVKLMAEKLYDVVLCLYKDVKANPYVLEVDYPVNFEVNFTPSVPYEKKKLAVLFSGDKYAWDAHELYSERRRVINFFEKEHPDEFDFYGWNWNEKYKAYKCYKGVAECKLTVGENYKYAVCLANEVGVANSLDEKIFEAMFAGNVPVFAGTKDIAQYIPDGCYIDYTSLKSPKALYRCLSSISKEEYLNYIQNINAYLASPQIDMLKPEAFAKKLVEAVKLGSGRKMQRDLRSAWVLEIKRKIYGRLCSVKKRLSH